MDSEGRTIVTEYAARFKSWPSRGNAARWVKRREGVKSSFRVRVKVGCEMG